MTFSKDVNITERHKVKIAQFYGRVAYYLETGRDLPLEAFIAEKNESGNYTVTLKEEVIE